MPSAVFVSSKPCSIAHRTPLSHTNRRNGVLAGALLREEAYVGLAPRVRLITSHPVRAGSPSLLSVTRLRANAYTYCMPLFCSLLPHVTSCYYNRFLPASTIDMPMQGGEKMGTVWAQRKEELLSDCLVSS